MIRIFLADDHFIVREGLKHIIDSFSDFKVVAEAGSGREVLSLCRKMKVDVVLMDISMPDMNGIEAVTRIKGESSEIRIIVLSMHNEANMVRKALRAGADGYMLKSSDGTCIQTAVKAVLNGQSYLSPEISRIVIDGYLRNSGEDDGWTFDMLTNREREVLQLIAEGRTSKQIAELLNLSIRTVENHRRQIMSKLGLNSVAALTKYAISEGLTDIRY